MYFSEENKDHFSADTDPTYHWETEFESFEEVASRVLKYLIFFFLGICTLVILALIFLGIFYPAELLDHKI